MGLRLFFRRVMGQRGQMPMHIHGRNPGTVVRTTLPIYSDLDSKLPTLCLSQDALQ